MFSLRRCISFLRIHICINSKSINALNDIKVRHASRTVIHQLRERGMLENVFPDDDPELPHLLASGKQCAYAGFDPTSDSLHIGNLFVIISLIHWQRAGHNVIILLGDATAGIGDPSGKLKEREILPPDIIKSNSLSIEKSIHRIFENHEKCMWNVNPQNKPLKPIRILRNSSWYESQNVLTFFNKIGRNVRLVEMLSRSSVQNRLESKKGMNFTEFSYQVLQSYDWVHLYDNFACRFQFGGNDQMGNIHTGHDMVDRMRQKTVYGLMVPLIKSQSGEKYGKTEGPSVWLNENKTTPFEFYQAALSLPDAEINRYLKYFTFFPLPDIEIMTQKHMKNSNSRYGQKKIAEELTLLVHGEEALKKAKKMTQIIYHSTPEALAQLTELELKEIFSNAIYREILLEPGTTVLDMVLKANCYSSLDEARHAIKARKLYVNNQIVPEPSAVLIQNEHVLPNGISIISKGKRNHFLIKWASLPI